MGKKSTPTPAATPAPAPAAAPSQPWEKPAGAAVEKPADSATPAPPPTPTPAPAATDTESPVVVTGDKQSSEERDQLTPVGEPPAQLNEQLREESGGNGGGTETTVHSEDKDQVTPVGASPAEVDAEAEALTPPETTDRVSAEAKDQVTPVGEDLSSTLFDQIRDLDENEQAEFSKAMQATAERELERIRRNREAAKLQRNMVDGQQHYGARVYRGMKPRSKEKTNDRG